MAKVLLVEDDVNLREIYAARLQSEGFETSTADDGENALAIAVKEKPDLIILDVMMPKISGFDVLDILRSTPETKNAKIMMMTALSQDGDKERGEKLGANRYLVKSQVTLEDMVANAKQLLEEGGVAVAAEAPAEQPAAPAEVAPTAPSPTTEPSAPAPTEPPVAQVDDTQTPAPTPPEPTAATVPQVQDTPSDDTAQTVVNEPTTPAPTEPVAAEPPTTAPTTEPEPTAPEPAMEPQAPATQAEPEQDDFSVQTPGTVIQPTPADQDQSQQ